jgi:hypothetical protein
VTGPGGAELLSGGAERAPTTVPRVAKAVLAAGLAVAAAGVFTATREDAPVVPPPTLSVVDDGIGVTTSGVIVLSVELRDGGAGLAIRSAELTATPVLQPASVNAPDRVRPGGTVRLVAIVQPDCRALGPGEAAPLEASMVVRVVPPSGRENDLRLDLGGDPVLLGRLRGLCSQVRTGQGGAVVGFVSAGFDRVEATIGLGGGDGADGGGGVGLAELRSISAPGLRFTLLGRALPAPVPSGTGLGVPVAVTVEACADVTRPPAGSNPDAHVWGSPQLEVAGPDGAVTTLRAEPAAVSELYSTAVRRIVENACDGPPR